MCGTEYKYFTCINSEWVRYYQSITKSLYVIFIYYLTKYSYIAIQSLYYDTVETSSFAMHFFENGTFIVHQISRFHVRIIESTTTRNRRKLIPSRTNTLPNKPHHEHVYYPMTYTSDEYCLFRDS